MRYLLLAVLATHTIICSAQSCVTERKVFIENKSTKVWQTTLCPHQKLPPHSHDYARVLIPEEDGQIKVIYETGKVEVINLHKKIPIFLSLAQGKELHEDENPGDETLHMTLIELRTAVADQSNSK
ncbi:hypothetical protein [Legionella waltersii]|uniref:Cupin domain protein n=1 Tax=Legionella waltersii TaxID=66969 RepID=A0A0W1AAC8_9GAMM|nr:hypothetical protein [Legionella waltersii]KTD78316.1 hypothetical protein Lwal_1751 [Legionella waltersii]SNV08747.1 Uncharacterised protein [Legionella waltersii]